MRLRVGTIPRGRKIVCRSRNIRTVRPTCWVFGERTPTQPHREDAMFVSDRRAAARQDTHDILSDLRSTLEGIINNPASSEIDRAGALAELTAVNSRWESLLDQSRKVSTYQRIGDDFRDRLDELEAAGAGQCGCAEASGREYFTMPGGPVSLDRLPELAPMYADYTDGASMAKLLNENPEAFKAWWSGLSADERDIGMMQMQDAMQQRTQLQTMITNMMSTQHDSIMAIARNLSV